MRLGLVAMGAGLNFGPWGPGMAPNVSTVQFAESAGYETVWVFEAYGTDAVVPLTWLAAHTSAIKLGSLMQVTAREPSTAAMTAATLDRYCDGRLILGLGVSGPAVVEGWHSKPYGKPIARMEEYVEVIRRVTARTNPVELHGEFYDLPYRKADGTGLGKAMSMTFRPRRRRIPVYLAAMGSRAVDQAHRIADGIVPAFYSPYREDRFYEGIDRSRKIDVAPLVQVAVGSDLDACRDRLRTGIAFFLGGMGPQGVNFYNRLIARLGFEDVAGAIQHLYLSGRYKEAAATIPDELIDEVALAGPPERIRDRLEAWKASSVTTMLLTNTDPETVKVMAELAL